MSKKYTKHQKIYVNIAGYTWVILWFGSIWITQYSIQLFLTGLFLFSLIMLWICTIEDQPQIKKNKGGKHGN